jgi:hypothetical protein
MLSLKNVTVSFSKYFFYFQWVMKKIVVTPQIRVLTSFFRRCADTIKQLHLENEAYIIFQWHKNAYILNRNGITVSNLYFLSSVGYYNSAF